MNRIGLVEWMKDKLKIYMNKEKKNYMINFGNNGKINQKTKS